MVQNRSVDTVEDTHAHTMHVLSLEEAHLLKLTKRGKSSAQARFLGLCNFGL